MSQGSLFDASGYDDPNYSVHNPEQFVASAVWHATDRDTMPTRDRPKHTHRTEYGGAQGLHAGSEIAAEDRRGARRMFPLRLNTTVVSRPERPGEGYGVDPTMRIDTHGIAGASRPSEGHTWDDHDANYMYKSNDALAAGQGVAYKNAVEDKGSISYRAPLRDYSTWSEQPGTSPLLEHARSTGSELVRQMRHYRDGAQQPALFAEKRVYDKGHRSVVGYDEPEAARVWARHYNANTMPLDPSSAEAGSMTTGSQHRSVTSYEIVPGAARPRPKRKRG